MGDMDRLLGDDLVSKEDSLEAASQAMPSDLIDHTLADELREEWREGLAEGEKTLEEIFDDLSPQQKAAALSALNVSHRRNYSATDPLFIDWKEVPKELWLHWLSPDIIKSFGHRGYRRVRRTPETVRWVPNAPQYGTKEFITHGNMILGAISKREKLVRDALDMQQSGARIQKLTEGTQEALERTQRALGATGRPAAYQTPEGERMTVFRGPDPESPDRPDMMSADEIESSQRHGPPPRPDTGMSREAKRRVLRNRRG